MAINNKRFTLSTLVISVSSFVCYGGPKTRDYTDSYIGNGAVKESDVLTGVLLIAGGALIIILLSRINTGSPENSPGCLVVIGIILVIVGLLFLAPLFDLLGTILYAVICVIAIPIFVLSLFKRNK